MKSALNFRLAVMFTTLAIVTLCLLGYANAWEQVDRTTYFGTTDKPLPVSWDLNTGDGTEYYEIQRYSVERETVEPLIKATAPPVDIPIPRTGMYIMKVRACSTFGGTQEPTCSEWSESIDPTVATVNNNPRGWWVYGYPAAPGIIVIE